MPLTNLAPVGDFSVSAASEYLFRQITAAPVASFDSDWIFVPQMPNLVFYLIWTENGATTVSITPQVSPVQFTAGGLVPAPTWINLSAPVVCPVATPILLNFQFPTALARLRVTTGGGGPNAGFNYYVGAFG